MQRRGEACAAVVGLAECRASESAAIRMRRISPRFTRCANKCLHLRVRGAAQPILYLAMGCGGRDRMGDVWRRLPGRRCLIANVERRRVRVAVWCGGGPVAGSRQELYAWCDAMHGARILNRSSEVRGQFVHLTLPQPYRLLSFLDFTSARPPSRTRPRHQTGRRRPTFRSPF